MSFELGTHWQMNNKKIPRGNLKRDGGSGSILFSKLASVSHREG